MKVIIPTSIFLFSVVAQLPSPLKIKPPPELYSVATARIPINEHHQGLANLDTNARTVTIAWSHYPTPKHHVGRTTESVPFTVSFYPTAVATGANATLYVGGTRVNGKTAIEKWTFDVPPTLPDEATALDRTTVTTIYNAITTGRAHVVHLAPSIGIPGVIVQHYDSRDLWLYVESSASWTQAASPIGGSPLLVPELDDVLWTSMHARSHKTLGGMYSFRSDTSDHVLVILDGDKDGVLNSAQLLDTQGWAAAGFGDPDNYDSWP